MRNSSHRKGASRALVRGTDFLIRGLDPIPPGLEGSSAHEALSALHRARNALSKRGLEPINTRERNQVARALEMALDNVSGRLYLTKRRGQRN